MVTMFTSGAESGDMLAVQYKKIWVLLSVMKPVVFIHDVYMM